MDGSSQSDRKKDDNCQSSNKTDMKDDDLVDEELDELLDDTLSDFKNYSASAQSSDEVKSEKAVGAEGPNKSNNQPDLANAIFGGLSGGAGGDFDDQLRMLLEGDEQVMAELAKLSKMGSEAASSQADSQKAFADTLSETLASLSQNAESLQQSDLNDDELMKQFEESLKLGSAEGGDPESNFIPMMQNMMSSLLSKDVLYPSLKDLADKYPAWLSSNNGKIPKQQFDSYAKQFDIVTKLCEEYQSENSNESQQVKDERFERILDLMTQMQDCGAPPKDIVSELAPGLSFDSQGQPVFPGMEQCSIM